MNDSVPLFRVSHDITWHLQYHNTNYYSGVLSGVLLAASSSAFSSLSWGNAYSECTADLTGYSKISGGANLGNGTDSFSTGFGDYFNGLAPYWNGSSPFNEDTIVRSEGTSACLDDRVSSFGSGGESSFLKFSVENFESPNPEWFTISLFTDASTYAATGFKYHGWGTAHAYSSIVESNSGYFQYTYPDSYADGVSTKSSGWSYLGTGATTSTYSNIGYAQANSDARISNSLMFWLEPGQMDTFYLYTSNTHEAEAETPAPSSILVFAIAMLCRKRRSLRDR